MKETKDDALATTEGAAVATAQAKPFDIQALMSGEFDLNSLSRTEQLELMREIMEVEASLDLIALPIVSSIEILNHPITVHDAFHKTIIDSATNQEKLCVNFLCENAGEKFVAGDPNTPVEVENGAFFTVLKGANSFNDIYVLRFRKLRGVAVMPLAGYNFAEDAKYRRAGNNAIVLRKVAGSGVVAAKSVK